MALKIDHIDARIIMDLQEDASQSQRDLADKIGLSQNACWRRIKQLQEGDYDYMLKIVTRDMKSYDEVYQRLIEKLDLENVTSYFTMEAILENRAIPIR